jgi:hypothetical protein
MKAGGRVFGLVLLFVAALACAVIGPGCSKKAKKSSSSSKKSTNGQTIMTATKSSQSAINAQKGSAKKTSTTPKPVPAPAKSGSTTINPPTLSGDMYDTWTFAQVDIDGDGELESGQALYDATNDVLCIWWSESDYLGGEMISYDGFAWVDDSDAGFILTLDTGGVFGCAEAASSTMAAAGCVACDDMGDCAEVTAADDYGD